MNWFTLGFIFSEAGSSLLIKHLLNLSIHPYFLVLTTGIASALLMIGLFWQKPNFKQQLTKLSSIKIVLPTAIFIGLGNLLGFWALKITTVTNYTLLCRTSILITPIFAWLIVKEKINHKIWPLIGISLVGIWWLTGSRLIIFNFSGDSLALLTAITISLDFIFQKKALNQLTPEVVAVWRRLIQAVFVGVIWLMTPLLGRADLIADFKWIGLMTIGYLFMSILMAKAIKSQPVADFNLLVNLTPVLVGIGAYLWLGEKLNQLQLAGGGLILGAVMIYNLIKHYDLSHYPRAERVKIS